MNFVNKFLKGFGFQLHKSNSLKKERAFYDGTIDRIADFYIKSMVEDHDNLNKMISGIVFSKDRAMQLHALLSSYFHYTNNPGNLIILFTCSNREHEISYIQLEKEFQSFPVTFMKEVDFSIQLKEIVSNLSSDRLFFMTDDAVFLDYYDLHDCLQFHPVTNIFSLRLGLDLDYCFAYNKAQHVPNSDIQNINDTTFNTWKWRDMTESPDWIYPLSLDGTIFYKKEIEVLLSHITFTSPNSLEAQMQLYKELFLGRNGVCFSKVKYVNIPCNIVQKEFDNRSNDTYSVEELVSYFLKGQRIDWRKLENLKASEAQKTKFVFVSMNKYTSPLR